MTNDKTVTMSREHVERLADRLSKAQMFKESSELRALLAAPAVCICRGCFTEQPSGTACVTCAKVEAERAAPVVERQEPKGALIRSREYVGIGQGGRELWHDWTEWLHTTVAHAQSKIEQTKDLSSIQFEVEWLYTSPPAPVAVVLPARRDTPEYWNPYQNPSAERACGWNGYGDELKRLNPELFAKVQGLSRP